MIKSLLDGISLIPFLRAPGFGPVLGASEQVLRYLLGHPQELWSHLPTDPDEILAMRRRVCEISSDAPKG